MRKAVESSHTSQGPPPSLQPESLPEGDFLPMRFFLASARIVSSTRIKLLLQASGLAQDKGTVAEQRSSDYRQTCS